MDKRIDEIEPVEDEYFVWLKRGYRLNLDYSKDGKACQHCFGAIDKKEIRETMEEVVSCDCDTCLN